MFECGKGVYYSNEIIEYVRENFNCVVKDKPIAGLLYEYYAELDDLLQNNLVFGNRVIELEEQLYSIRLPKITSVYKTGLASYTTSLARNEFSLISAFLIKIVQRSLPSNTGFLRAYDGMFSDTRTNASLILANLTVLASSYSLIQDVKYFRKIDKSKSPSMLDELKEFNYLPVIEKLDL